MSVFKTKKEDKIISEQVAFQVGLEDYYRTCISKYSNSNLVSMLYSHPDHRVSYSPAPSEHGVLVIFETFPQSFSTVIPLTDFKYFKEDISETLNIYQSACDFFAQCELNVIKDIRSTWFPISVITGYMPNGVLRPTKEFFYIYCPKTGIPYKVTRKGLGYIFELSYVVIGYFGD